MKKYIKHFNLYFHAFTLVELIVVIVILAILSTIAFLSFNSYSTSARDSVRMTDNANINSALNLYYLKSGYFPQPEGIISTGTINGVDIIFRGEIQDSISKLISISKTPIDPLSNTFYKCLLLINQCINIYGYL